MAHGIVFSICRPCLWTEDEVRKCQPPIVIMVPRRWVPWELELDLGQVWAGQECFWGDLARNTKLYWTTWFSKEQDSFPYIRKRSDICDTTHPKY